MTNEQADYLLKLPKKIVKEDKLCTKLIIEQKFPFYERFELVSETDDEFSFLWKIQQSAKNTIRISLHFQEDDRKTGLLRIDFNGGHTNPEIINEYLPEKFRSYAGKVFSNTESHVHYHVQGYKSLAWAIPLTDDTFEIKAIDEKNLNSSFADIIKSFAKTINIETVITTHTLLNI
jgi:hypothetical protein